MVFGLITDLLIDASVTLMKTITLYTSTGCDLCLILKKWLRQRSVDFVEKSLSDTNVMSGLIMSDIYLMSAPALEIAGEFYTVDKLFSGDLMNEKLLEQTLEMN